MDAGLNARFDFSELLALGSDAIASSDALVGLLKVALARGSTAGMATAREEAPVFTGEFAGSIVVRGVQVREMGSSIRLDDLISTSVAHSIVVEEGRAAGARRPPLGPIYRWVQLQVRRGKFDLSWTQRETQQEQIYAAALFVAAWIQRRGIPAKHPMRKGAVAAEIVLHAEVEAAAAELRRRIETP